VKLKSASLGMFRSERQRPPPTAGEISSVEMLSPTFSSTGASMSLGSSESSGRLRHVGPLDRLDVLGLLRGPSWGHQHRGVHGALLRQIELRVVTLGVARPIARIR